MAQAKIGDIVKVHYTGKLVDGTIFDSSKDREPLGFELGKKLVIPGFENAVVGMELKETKTINIPASEAYGSYNKDLVASIAKKSFPENIEIQVGQKFELKQPDGAVIVVEVTNVENDQVIVDANHPLAGEDLIFEIELIDIVS